MLCGFLRVEVNKNSTNYLKKLNIASFNGPSTIQYSELIGHLIGMVMLVVKNIPRYVISMYGDLTGTF